MLDGGSVAICLRRRTLRVAGSSPALTAYTVAGVVSR